MCVSGAEHRAHNTHNRYRYFYLIALLSLNSNYHRKRQEKTRYKRRRLFRGEMGNHPTEVIRLPLHGPPSSNFSSVYFFYSLICRFHTTRHPPLQFKKHQNGKPLIVQQKCQCSTPEQLHQASEHQRVIYKSLNELAFISIF